MNLSSDLISQFVKITNDTPKSKKESTYYGTTVAYNGSIYVKLDGSELLTPVSTTTDLKAGERVIVMIKNHTATVTGNITAPAARSSDVRDVGNELSEFEIIITGKLDALEIDAVTARLDNLQSDNVLIKEVLSVNTADISTLEADNATIRQTLVAVDADISSLKTNKLDSIIADIKYAQITDLNAVTADLNSLESTYGDFTVLTADKFSAVDASISELNANKLSANDAAITYANIDFSNIGIAAMEYFYAKSGLIENVVVSDGTITGKLIGVTITGDLIEGNTVVADKLVIKGSDGLFYKLNTDGVTTELEQTNQNSLNGSVITAKSITATKISVDDLVAFDATIGGFNITESSLYSGAKESVDNTARGVYLDSTGQIAFGDSNNFIKYYQDTDGTYKLAISASSIVLSSSNQNVEEALEKTSNGINENADQIANAESLIQQLSDSISMLVTDGNGTSLMEQTENGWTFSTIEIQSALNTASENLDALNNSVDSVSHTVDILREAVDDLGAMAEYIKITTYEGEPCIELGEGDSDFKLLITNTRIMFMEGSSVPAYINNQSLYINKAVIEEELQQGGFVWKARTNGNLGLVWKGVI